MSKKHKHINIMNRFPAFLFIMATWAGTVWIWYPGNFELGLGSQTESNDEVGYSFVKL
jgi:hypothetical protein